MLSNRWYLKHGLNAVRDCAKFAVFEPTNKMMVLRCRDRGFLLQDPNPIQK